MPFKLPGTWALTAHHGGGPFAVHPIIVFTANRSVIERVEFTDAASLGVWEPGEEENEFQFMFIRYTATPPATAPPGTAGERLRSKNRFTGPHAFTGVGCAEYVDATGKFLQTLGSTTHTGVRMQLLPWTDPC